MTLRRKDRRFLVRLANSAHSEPSQSSKFLRRLRALAAALPGDVMNVRISPLAVELDLFVSEEQPIEPFLAAWENVGKPLTVRPLDETPGSADPAVAIPEAKRFWDEHRFWEVHEILETPWKAAQGAEREWLQGLILGAAARVHLQKDERAVVPSMIHTALSKLEGSRAHYHGWDLEKFREELKRLGIMSTSL